MLFSFMGSRILRPALTWTLECSAESIPGNCKEGSESRKLDSAVTGLSTGIIDLEVEKDCLTEILLKLNAGATRRREMAR